MPLDADWMQKVEHSYLAKQPIQIAISAKKPLTLKMRVAVTVADRQIQNWVANISSRQAAGRSKFDPRLFQTLETAILIGDVDQIHAVLAELYEANRDPETGWIDQSVIEFLSLVGDDLEPVGLDLASGMNNSEISVNIAMNYPTPDSLSYMNLYVSSITNQEYARAFTGIRFEQSTKKEEPKAIANRLAKAAYARLLAINPQAAVKAVTAESAVEEPASKQSATKQPDTKQSATKQPDTKQSATKEPATKEPAARLTKQPPHTVPSGSDGKKPAGR